MVPVTDVIRGALPWTLGLVGTATVVSFILGTLLGVLVAWRRGSWLDTLLPATTFFQAAPYFFLAFLAIDLFAIKLGWFPPERAYGQLDFPAFDWTYISDVLDHAILPALTIVVASAAGWIVGMRNVMITTMDEDYVLIAQAKGLPKRRVVWYAARNAILPSISGFSLAIGFVVSGALLTEIVFSYPGLGFLMLSAVQEADYALLQGIFLVITMARPGGQPRGGLRLRVPRPAHPAGGLIDGHRQQHGPGQRAGRRPARAVPDASTSRRRLRLPRSPKVLIGLAGLIGFLVLAVIGPWIAPYDPPQIFSTTVSFPQPPSAAHWLGTTQQQQDVLSQLLAGGRSTILVAFVAGLIATVLSVVVGVAAGYAGGLADDLLSMLANLFLILPALPLLIVIFGFLPPSQGSDDVLIGLIIAITGWAFGARVLRAQTLSLRTRDYVDSARIIGERGWRIIGFEILPNLIPILASSFLFTVLYGVGTYTALAFLGLVNPNHVSWGGMLFYAQVAGAEQSGYWWLYIPPGLAVALLGTSPGAAQLRYRRVHQPAAAGRGAIPAARTAGRSDRGGAPAPPVRARRDPGSALGSAGRRPQGTRPART